MIIIIHLVGKMTKITQKEVCDMCFDKGFIEIGWNEEVCPNCQVDPEPDQDDMREL